jgi:hypothetical protein
MNLNHDYDKQKSLIKQYYSVWSAVWRALCNWDSERINRWAQRFANAMHGPSPFFFHESALSYVVGFLIPENVSATTRGSDLIPILTELERELSGGDPRCEMEVSSFDWNAAASRVDAVLAKYGSSLQAICRRLDAQRVGLP